MLKKFLSLCTWTLFFLMGFISFLIFIYIGSLIFLVIEKNWSLLESVYFFVATLTTVGYGDIEPKSMQAKIACTACIIINTFIFSNALGYMCSKIFQRYEDIIQSIVYKIFKDNSKKYGFNKKNFEIFFKNPLIKIFLLIFIICLLEIVNIIFFVWYEKWTFVDSLYFSITTITTVGYGDITPKTSLGKSMCIIQMLFGVLFTTTFVAMMIDYFIRKHQDNVAKRMMERELDLKYLKELDADNSGGVTLDEFMYFILLKNNKVDKEFLDSIVKHFKMLDKNGDGKLNKDDLRLVEKSKKINIKDLEKGKIISIK